MGVSTRGTSATRGALAALSGLVAGYAALAVAELVSAGVRPEAGPVAAVGGAAIDRTPSGVKDWAIRQFGTNDKLVLQLGIVAVLAAFAVAMGLLALRRRRTAAAGVLAFGLVGAVAATSRPDSTGLLDAVPSLTGALAGAGVLYVLTGYLRAGYAGSPGHPTPSEGSGHPTPSEAAEVGAAAPEGLSRPAQDGHALGRRGFVLATTGAVVASTGAGLLGRRLSATSAAEAAASRAAVRLPAPASPAPPLPRGVDLRIREVAPFTTPNRDFYRVDTALNVPRLDAGRWRMRLHGKGVSAPRVLTFDDLLQRALIERDITMTCVSNEVGGPYVGSARWLGVPLRALLEEAGVRPPSRGGPADQLVARSVDGMTIGSPVETVMDGRDAMLAIGMNGEPLPFDHGFPVRMLVPGLYGYVSACKWIEDIELTTFEDYDAYWVKRDWAREAPIKTQSRIDTPKPFARPASGRVTVAGVAWAQHRGIDRVEVRVDEGPWRQAELATEGPLDTWRQWRWDWDASPGSHTLQVRATDGTGTPQTDRRTRTIPDGASGWHSVVVNVT
ncbi:molybdopterin-dependent oxidoreductase [Streptomyces sp. TRM66268-LWL]|uniref:Molybdopterin-dependent oxidoreductase n=1 Tax=Streptomyces polyasparticus TaxID=2767826 RepID=A0ABR7SDE1_9ACTN|nr:molybdopterin-dependent oxidoreductase [Streptomyces polyasparticus]MBC9712750.1 molybdopterin-dependent oxidoreductase [Streptomyces polyasparticus]